MQKLELRQNQSQKLTPQQIQFIKLLNLYSIIKLNKLIIKKLYKVQ